MRLPVSNLLISVACACLLGSCATQPENGEVMKYLEKAERAYESQDWRLAEEGYRELASRIPQDAYAYFRLGNTLAKQARFDEAAQAYQEALVRDAGMAKAYGNLGMVRLLQAEAALDASIAKASSNDTSTTNSKKMLKEIRKITNIPVLEVGTPVARSGKPLSTSSAPANPK